MDVSCKHFNYKSIPNAIFFPIHIRVTKVLFVSTCIFFPDERHADTIEHDTPIDIDHVSLPSGQPATQNETPQMEHESAGEDQGLVHGEEHDADVAVPPFPGSFHVTSRGTLETTFLVDEELIPYKMENIPGTIDKMF